LLHDYLLGSEDVFAPLGSLSFGKRARLVLARLVAQGCNSLLWDEPIDRRLPIPPLSYLLSPGSHQPTISEFGPNVL
jgi:hypothetical protein